VKNESCKERQGNREIGLRNGIRKTDNLGGRGEGILNSALLKRVNAPKGVSIRCVRGVVDVNLARNMAQESSFNKEMAEEENLISKRLRKKEKNHIYPKKKKKLGGKKGKVLKEEWEDKT